MAHTSRLALALGALVLAAGAARAVELGGLEVASALGEPLDARVPVTAQAGERFEAACFYLTHAGLPEGTRLAMTLERSARGTALRIRGTTPLDVPAATLGVAVACPGREPQPLREYALLLDPRGRIQPATTAAAPDIGATINSRGDATLESIARTMVPDDARARSTYLDALGAANPGLAARGAATPIEAGTPVALPDLRTYAATRRSAAQGQVAASRGDSQSTTPVPAPGAAAAPPPPAPAAKAAARPTTTAPAPSPSAAAAPPRPAVTAPPKTSAIPKPAAAPAQRAETAPSQPAAAAPAQTAPAAKAPGAPKAAAPAAPAKVAAPATSAGARAAATPAAEGGFVLRLSGAEIDLTRSRGVDDRRRAQLRERQLVLDADDQLSAFLAMKHSLKQLEARVSELQLKLAGMPASFPDRPAPAAAKPAPVATTPAPVTAPAMPDRPRVPEPAATASPKPPPQAAATAPTQPPPQSAATVPPQTPPDAAASNAQKTAAAGPATESAKSPAPAASAVPEPAKATAPAPPAVAPVVKPPATSPPPAATKPAPPKQPGTATPPAREGELVSLWREHGPWLAGVLALAVVAFFALAAWRRRRAAEPEEADEEEDAAIEPEAGEPPIAGDVGEIAAPVAASQPEVPRASISSDANLPTRLRDTDSGDLRRRYIEERFPEVASRAIRLEDTDSVVKGARLFYEDGEVPRAVELLQLAIEARPAEARLWLALFEIFRLERLAGEFGELARRFQEVHAGSEHWRKVQYFGREVDPGNAMYKVEPVATLETIGPREARRLAAANAAFDPIAENWLNAPMDFENEVLANDLRRSLMAEAGIAEHDLMPAPLTALRNVEVFTVA